MFGTEENKKQVRVPKLDSTTHYTLEDLLAEAVRSHATDIHICVGAPVKMRVYGDLIPMKAHTPEGDMILPELSDERGNAMLKSLMDADARQTYSSTGNYDMSYMMKDNSSRFRVNIFKQGNAIAAVFRVLPTKILRAEELGLPKEFFELTKRRRGMVLVTGVTGSGKSTTLAAFIDIINRTMPKNILSLEDPIEYEHWHAKSNICQREIGKDVMSFEQGLRAALREDPDVILVGEMRDRETIDIALKCAETGHLLLSTLHTLGCVETVNRIVDSFPESQHNQIRSQFASCIEAVISQQLCPKAGGEKGYVVAYEILYTTRQVKHLIRANDIEGLEDYLRSEEARALGMTTMDDSLYNLYISGQITRETAVTYAVDKQAMEKRI